jgi:hypothetical protein
LLFVGKLKSKKMAKSPAKSKRSVSKDKPAKSTDKKKAKKGADDAKSTTTKNTKKSVSKSGVKSEAGQPGNQLALFPQIRFCVAHNTPLEYFCESCEEPICTLCTTLGPHNNQVPNF